jgi:hypothetical protein
MYLLFFFQKNSKYICTSIVVKTSLSFLLFDFKNKVIDSYSKNLFKNNFLKKLK